MKEIKWPVMGTSQALVTACKSRYVQAAQITVSKVNNAGTQILKPWFAERRIRVKINKH